MSGKDSLFFDDLDYEVFSCQIEGQRIVYRAFRGRVYCERPVDEFQKLNLFAPEEYFYGKSVNGYGRADAPILIQSSVGGYLPGPCEEPGMDGEGRPNTLARALAHGLVVASIGVRGRTSATGKAPALIVDWKAGIRYLRRNRERIPGNVERMITNGTSAGGALSALVGASGNHPDYLPYLEKLGAAEERDDVFAASCYCPIHNLEHADAAYEWLFCECLDFQGMKIERGEEGLVFTPVKGRLSQEQAAWSKELRDSFPAYVNSLGLKDREGRPLLLDEKGEGSFADFICGCIRESAQRELDGHVTRDHLSAYAAPGNAVEENPALTIEDGVVKAVDLKAYAAAITRMKQTPAFDAPDLSSAENEEFGTETVNTRHFTDFSCARSKGKGEKAEALVIRMMNPLSYLADGQADTAGHFRIRHGSYDRDTSLAIPAILAVLLENQGCEVDFALPWGVPHRGDYDLEELFAWIDGICTSLNSRRIEMGRIKGLHHVHLKCREDQAEEVLHFYVEVLGLALLDRREDCAVLDSGNGILEIFWDAEKLLGQGDIRHFAFLVEDVDACVRAVEQAGYRIKEYPVDVMFALGRPTPARIAFCYGALGEEVEFFQLREGQEGGR